MAMVEAASSAGVPKFVFSSVIHPSISKLTNHAAKRPVEEALYESGMEFTVLQPTMFMQNLDNGWSTVLEHGHFSLPYSKQAKACYVDYRDVAEAAALALMGDHIRLRHVRAMCPWHGQPRGASGDDQRGTRSHNRGG